MQPAQCFSGGNQPERDDRKNLPNMTDMAHDIENSELLQQFLSVLEKHKCLDSPVWKGKRSPWVKAFCDLYHPAGAWGTNKFRSKLTMTSPSRYTFKTTKVQKVYEALKKGCLHVRTPGIHRRLLDKLEEFMSKKKYYDDYIAACKMIAEQEVRKPPAERAPFPAIEIDDNYDNSREPSVTAATTREENAEGSATPNIDNEAQEIQVVEIRASSDNATIPSAAEEKDHERGSVEQSTTGTSNSTEKVLNKETSSEDIILKRSNSDENNFSMNKRRRLKEGITMQCSKAPNSMSSSSSEDGPSADRPLFSTPVNSDFRSIPDSDFVMSTDSSKGSISDSDFVMPTDNSKGSDDNNWSKPTDDPKDGHVPPVVEVGSAVQSSLVVPHVSPEQLKGKRLGTPQTSQPKTAGPSVAAAATGEEIADSTSNAKLDSASSLVVPHVSPEQLKGRSHGTSQTSQLETTTPSVAAAATGEEIADSTSNAKVEEQQILEKRRKGLAEILLRRKQEGNGGDETTQIIKSKIDQLDVTLTELILS